MCFYFQQNYSLSELEEHYNIEVQSSDLSQPQNYINGFTFPKTVVVANNKPTVLQYFDWGLIPRWAKDINIRKCTLNAKIETLSAKPSFRGIINQRCLVPADAFFEWQWLDSKGKRKQKYCITLPDQELFSLAGIWSSWTDPITAEIKHTYSLVTTEANILLSRIHNSKKRMPVVLTKEKGAGWLNQRNPHLSFRRVEIELKARPIN